MKFAVALLCLPIAVQAQVLATVGTAKITVEDFNRRYEDVKTKALNPPAPEQFLEDLIRFEVAVQEAEKINLHNEPAVRERYKQLLYNHLLETKLGERVDTIKITEKELKDYYKNNPEVKFGHIMITFKPGGREGARKKAADLTTDLRKSKLTFEDAVQRHSEDASSKANGGDLGFQSNLTLPPALYGAVKNLKTGEIAGPVETQFGFHIVKMFEKRGYEMADKQLIRAAVLDGRRDKIFDEYFEKTKKAYKVELNKEALKSLKR